MSALPAVIMRRLLACALVAAVSVNATENSTQTKREVGDPFLKDVIRRIDNNRRQVARPVQDLQTALDRIAEIIGPEAATLDDSVTFELPENIETLSTSSSAASNVILPTAPTATGSAQPLSLTPQELQALYEIAAKKGLTLDLSSVQGGVLPPSAAPQNVKGAASVASPSGIAGPTPIPQQTGSTPDAAADGYVYYFVPIKNLNGVPLQQQTMQALMNQPNSHGNSESAAAAMASSAASHAADAAASAALMAGGADRAVEPLFMAMAGFVGMALMFVASVLFLPKLGALRSLKHAPDEVASIGKLVLQSIEGKDCSERLTCEIGRAARTLKLGGKPLRVLELVLPPPMAVQISRIRRAVARKEKCNFIPCKFRRPLKIPLPPKKPFIKPHPLKPSLFKPALKPPARPVRLEKPANPQPTQPSIFGTPFPEEKISASISISTSPRPPQQKKNPRVSQNREPRIRRR